MPRKAVPPTQRGPRWDAAKRSAGRQAAHTGLRAPAAAARGSRRPPIDPLTLWRSTLTPQQLAAALDHDVDEHCLREYVRLYPGRGSWPR